jgi:hypothetical protein
VESTSSVTHTPIKRWSLTSNVIPTPNSFNVWYSIASQARVTQVHLLILACYLEREVPTRLNRRSYSRDFLYFHTCHFQRITYKPTDFACGRSIMKDTLPEERITFSALSRLTIKGVPENTRLAICAHAQQKLKILLWSANNDGDFIWKVKYVLCCTSESIRRIFLKIHIVNCRCMEQNCFNFRCDRWKMKNSLLEYHSAF